MKLGRNDPCWCGSGKKYKKCHLKREDEPRLPFDALAAKSAAASHFKTCLHPKAAANTCGKMAHAHTLQRSRVLRSIQSPDHHIYTFYPIRIKGNDIDVNRIGWRKASTFDAFCATHDNEAFAPLERKPFTGTMDQIFLIGYRAVCWELYQKQRALRAGPTMSDLMDRGTKMEMQQTIQRMLSVQSSGLKIGYQDALKQKERMDAAFLAKDYSSYDAVRITMKGPLSIAATGAITPNRTMGGESIQTLHDETLDSEWLPFGVDIKSDGCCLVFLWEGKSAAPRKYMSEVVNLTTHELECFLPQFLFVHCENAYFSETWWHCLSDGERAFVKRLVSNSNPYYYYPRYELSRRLTEWKIASVEML